MFVGSPWPSPHYETHRKPPGPSQWKAILSIQVAGIVFPQSRQAIHHLTSRDPVVEGRGKQKKTWGNWNLKIKVHIGHSNTGNEYSWGTRTWISRGVRNPFRIGTSS